MEFLTKPKFIFEEVIDGDKHYSIKKPLMYRYKGKLHVINPSDENGVFITNLTSVPFFLRWLHRVNSKQTLYPSIIHDFNYSSRKTKRLYDDILLREATKTEQREMLKKYKGFERFKTSIRFFVTRWSIFLLLRAFGWQHKA